MTALFMSLILSGEAGVSDAAEPKALPFVNAGDFGLQAMEKNGDTAFVRTQLDSTDALQKAIDSAPGKTIFIPAGIFRITRPIHLHSGQTLCGAGSGNTVLTSDAEMEAVIHAKVSGPLLTMALN